MRYRATASRVGVLNHHTTPTSHHTTVLEHNHRTAAAQVALVKTLQFPKRRSPDPPNTLQPNTTTTSPLHTTRPDLSRQANHTAAPQRHQLCAHSGTPSVPCLQKTSLHTQQQHSLHLGNLASQPWCMPALATMHRTVNHPRHSKTRCVLALSASDSTTPLDRRPSTCPVTVHTRALDGPHATQHAMHPQVVLLHCQHLEASSS